MTTSEKEKEGKSALEKRLEQLEKERQKSFDERMREIDAPSRQIKKTYPSTPPHAAAFQPPPKNKAHPILSMMAKEDKENALMTLFRVPGGVLRAREIHAREYPGVLLPSGNNENFVLGHILNIYGDMDQPKQDVSSREP